MDNKALAGYIRKLIEEDKLDRFYKTKEFKRLRIHVLDVDKGFCLHCEKQNASIAHHVNHVKDRPDLALSIFWFNPISRKKERNIISVCKTCHNILHPEKLERFQNEQQKKEVNAEMW